MIASFLETVTSPNTRSTYARGLGYFSRWAEGAGVDVTTLRVRDILAFRSHLAGALSGASANTYLSALKSCLKWAAQCELVGAEVYAAATTVENVAQDENLPEVLTETQVAALLNAPNPETLTGARDLAIIALLVSSGMRISEMTGLDIETVDFDGRAVVVDGKGGKQRRAFFNGRAAGAIINYLALRGSPSNGPLFVNAQGERLSVRYIQEQLAGYGEVIGLGARLHPHSLRHTFATKVLDDSGDLDAVQRLLGHSSPTTTQRYVKTATKRLERVYRAALEEQETLTLAPVRVRVLAERTR
jgi:site-specific recombinase XerD